MTADGEALQTIAKTLDEYTMCESTMVLPVDVLIDALQRIEQRRPCDVTVGAIRSVLYAINDELVKDITRQSKKSKW